MQKKPKQQAKRSQSWLQGMFCCGSAPEMPDETKRMIIKRNTIRKKQVRIQLSLIGSPSRFCLCKMTRKNVAIDSYTYKGILPNQVNRYLSDRVRGETAVFSGSISSIMTRNVLFPMYLLDEHPGAPSPLGEVVVGTPKSFNPKYIDIFVSRPANSEISSLLTNTPTATSSHPACLSTTLPTLCTLYPKLIFLLPPTIILDQLGMLLPANKQVEIQSIMINGMCILNVIYIGDSDWLRVSQADKLDAMVRQLDAKAQQPTLRQLLDILLLTVDMEQILRLFVLAVAEEKMMDTNLNVFLRLVAAEKIMPTDQLEKMFKLSNLSMSYANTPVISPTGEFGRLISFREEELLNKGQKQLSRTYEVQSHYEQQFTLFGSQMVEQPD